MKFQKIKKLIVKFFKELKKHLPNAVVLVLKLQDSIIKHWQTTEPHLLCLNFYFFTFSGQGYLNMRNLNICQKNTIQTGKKY